MKPVCRQFSFGLGFEIGFTILPKLALNSLSSCLSVLGVGLDYRSGPPFPAGPYIYIFFKLEKHFTCTKMCTGKKEKWDIRFVFLNYSASRSQVSAYTFPEAIVPMTFGLNRLSPGFYDSRCFFEQNPVLKHWRSSPEGLRFDPPVGMQDSGSWREGSVTMNTRHKKKKKFVCLF